MRHMDPFLTSCRARRLPYLTAAAVLILLVLFGGLAAPVAAQKRLPIAGRVQTKNGRTFAAGEIVVGLRQGLTLADTKAAFLAANVEVVRALGLKRYYLLRVATANGQPAADNATLAAVKSLQNSNLFVYAGPNKYVSAMDVTPNDPMYPQQWHLPLMNMPKAWGVFQGSPNVIVADLDTGIDVAHPDLQARILPGVNFTVPVGDPNRTNVQDGFGHGTHTAGIAAAITNNGTGVSGVCWLGSMIFPGKVLDDQGFGTFAGIADGITYVADNVKTAANKVVINMSLGADVDSDVPDPTDPTVAACVYAASKDCVICIAAGNSYDVGNPASTPATAAQLDPRIFCVAAVGPQKEHSFFSTARPYTTVAAPGGDDPSFSNNAAEVLSTLPVSQGSYGYDQGTSMATPCVTGLVALMLGVGAAPSQCKDILTATADPAGYPVPSPELGYGVVNAYPAVALAAAQINLISPVSGTYVYGKVSAQLVVGDPTKLNQAKLTIDKDPTVVATTSGNNYTLVWDSQAIDPATNAPKYADKNHTLQVGLNLVFGQFTLARSVKLDNPLAAITSPAANGFVTKKVQITGTADGLRTPTYTVEYATAAAPSTWIPILANQNSRIQGGPLATWDLTQGGIKDGPVTVRLRVRNPDGFEVSTTAPVTIDQTPPTIPTNLKGVSSNKQVSLTWSPSVDNFQLAGYNIYRSNQSLNGYTVINSALVTTPQYMDPSLTNGVTYFYKVTAVDGAGNESAPTDLVSVTPNRNGTAGGQVTALDGTFLQNATVKVLQNGTALNTTTTDSAGQYAFASPPGFPAGTYQLQAAASGYVPQLIPAFSVSLGKDALGQDFVLQPQPVLPVGWSAFTLPYNFQGASLASVFSSASVRYYNPATGAYLKPGDAGFPNPGPGIGYWVDNTGGPAPIITGAGVPNSPATTAPVPIHKGWNLLGNPFQSTIHWALNNFIITRSDNGQQATLGTAVGLGWALDFGWGGPNGNTLLYDPAVVPGVADTVPGYGAFWFNSQVEGSMSVAPPPLVGNRAAKANVNTKQWAMPIVATAGTQTASAYIGLGTSRRLFPAPPQVTPGIQMGLSPDAQGTPGSGFAVDLRVAGMTQTWDLAVQGQDSSPITLTWPAVSRIPRGWRLSLIDRATGQQTDLRTASSYKIAGSRAVHALQIVLTAETEARMMISDVAVNTSRAISSIISYRLTTPGQATVSIVRANGTSVRMIGTRSVNSGSSTIVWDGRDNAGHSVPAGLYLVQIQAVGDKGDSAHAVLPFVLTR